MRSSLSFARAVRQANFDNFLRVHPQRPVVLREALPDCGLDNLLNRGVIAVVEGTAIGLGDSFFMFHLERNS